MFEKGKQRFGVIELFHIQTDCSDGQKENAKVNSEQQTAAVQFVRKIHKSRMENVLLSWPHEFNYRFLMLISGV